MLQSTMRMPTWGVDRRRRIYCLAGTRWCRCVSRAARSDSHTSPDSTGLSLCTQPGGSGQRQSSGCIRRATHATLHTPRACGARPSRIVSLPPSAFQRVLCEARNVCERILANEWWGQPYVVPPRELTEIALAPCVFDPPMTTSAGRLVPSGSEKLTQTSEPVSRGNSIGGGGGAMGGTSFICVCCAC